MAREGAEQEAGVRPCPLDTERDGAYGPETVGEFANGSKLFRPDVVGVGTVTEVRDERPGEVAGSTEREPEEGAGNGAVVDEASTRRLLFLRLDDVVRGGAVGDVVPIHFASRVTNPSRGNEVVEEVDLPCYEPSAGDRLVVSTVDLDGDGVHQFNSTWTGFFLIEHDRLSPALAAQRAKSPVAGFELVRSTDGTPVDTFVSQLRAARAH